MSIARSASRSALFAMGASSTALVRKTPAKQNKAHANMTNLRNRTCNFLLILPAMIGLLLAAPAEATILTFEINNEGSDIPMPPSYGDNVNSLSDGNFNYLEGNGFTPDIVLGYSASSGAIKYYSDSEWGDVAYLNSLSGSAYPRNFWFTFTPDAGYGVDINSFTLDPYESASNTVDWAVYAGSVGGSPLASGSESFSSNTDVTVSDWTPASGAIIMQISQTAGGNDVLALDNLNFDQVVIVPEPTSAALLLLAAAGGALLSRRRRR
jgi:hypothetical protein